MLGSGHITQYCLSTITNQQQAFDLSHPLLLLILFYEQFQDSIILLLFSLFLNKGISGASPNCFLRLSSFFCWPLIFGKFFSNSKIQSEQKNMYGTVVAAHVPMCLQWFIFNSKWRYQGPFQSTLSWNFLWSFSCLPSKNLFCLIFSFSHPLTGFSVSGRHRSRHF